MTELLTATDLEQWSERNDSREHLPTLVRRLILAVTAPETLRMPAAEAVGLPGLDGEVTSPPGAPPFVPPGRSVWELGTGRDPQDKAQRDYRKRVDGSTRDERAGVVFVFVTSRRWPDSQDWVDRRTEDDDGWAGIRVLDAEDLAAWLTLCPGVHRWLASEHLGRDPHGVIGLRDWYRSWAERTQPAIPAALLLAGRDDQVRRLRNRLRAEPGEQVVASASRDESVAFVATSLMAEPPQDVTTTPRQTSEGPPVDAPGGTAEPVGAAADAEPGEPVGSSAAEEGDAATGLASSAGAPAELEALLERALVVEDVRAWRRVAAHESPMVLVPVFAEPEIGDALRAGHHVVLPRAGRRADVLLPRLHRHLAREVWIAAGLDRDRADEYARAARRSLASLRRRIGRPGWLRQPPWALDTTANLLAPLLLAGAWADDVQGDLEALQSLTDRGWRATARDLSTLTSGEDAPLLLRGRRWEFADPVDAWDALNHALTAEDLDAFQSLAPGVLGESDPALGLTARERIAASLSETGVPRRRYSNTLRRGVATTAATLGAVVGDRELPGGLTGQQRASRVVRELLHRADAARWHAVADLLPLTAEAWPEGFLACVEHSLDETDPPVMSLFVETTDDFGLGGHSAHSPLLWALESLAWSPALLSRVAVVLGRLADRDPGGRLANRPSASLAAALHLRIPQGAGDAAARIAAVDAVRTVAPMAAWRLELDLVSHANRGMILVNGPKFRDWSRPPHATVNDVVDALDALAPRIADDAGADPGRLAAALALVDRFREAGRLVLLDAAETAWPDLQEEGRRTVLASLAERVAMHRRHPDAGWALPDQALQPLEAFLDAHALPGSHPEDAELFSWLPFRRGLNLDREDPDPEALAFARAEAVRRCLSDGLPAVLRLAEASEHPATVGDALASVTTDHDPAVLEHLAGSSQPLHAMAAGLAVHRQREDAGWLAATAVARPAQAGALCRTAAIDGALLTLVDGLESDTQDEFWRDMQPWGVPDDLTPTVARHLLQRGRAWAAIELLSHAGFGADLDLALQALKAPALAATEDISRVRSPQYTVGRLLDRLEEAGADDTLLADLEWFYQPLLDHSRRPTALHRELARNPARFVGLVSLMYGPDPDTGANSADEETRDNAASSRAFGAAWTVLRKWRTPLPGSVDGQLPTTEDMLRWLESVREMLTASGRARVLPVVLGDALSGAVADEDGTWPSEPVRDVLEILGDTDLDEHLAVARMNQRGVTSRGVYDGGGQERALAEQYSAAADRVRGRWPRSGALLDELSRSYREDARREDRSAESQGDR
ncbi:hypothetical protein [Micromonospora sp. KC213]|uniref:hypothetical protein n=1 Tax=Micromonospora sp. KC213 TaxID=2530378 RepID=UPI00105019B9|nr:hypothetical protein [Micromonospora sp. KC213]TDC41536.1 hypothetical protein E1166_11335 [Micromonospora sp. KC213]